MIKVSEEEAAVIIETREPRGLFYREDEDGSYIGIDNSTGDAWVEEFDDLTICQKWLNREFEMGNF